MSEPIDIRQLNAQIEAETGFITDLVEGMNRTIVGQKHLINSLLIGLRLIFRPAICLVCLPVNQT